MVTTVMIITASRGVPKNALPLQLADAVNRISLQRLDADVERSGDYSPETLRNGLGNSLHFGTSPHA